MPQVFPFTAIQYTDFTAIGTKIAPPYDVLSAKDKQALLHRDARNIVAIDLPHVPPKQLGPIEAYQDAATTLQLWLSDGTLARRGKPVMFAYRQSFDFLGQHYQRCGMCCTVETVPFGPRTGGGILPHEQTFSGPKEDRFALMRETQTQMSPIFGLHPDDDGAATKLVRSVMDSRDPDISTTLGEGPKLVTEEVWIIDDDETMKAYEDALDGEDVFIADGHHRYNTALNYLEYLKQAGDVAEDHPARRTMMVMVSMSDPGLAIGPTHRVLGGMAHYTFDAFCDTAKDLLSIETVSGGIDSIEAAMHSKGETHVNVLGLYDFATQRAAICTPRDPDPLQATCANRHESWRQLDVALVQHLIVEQICAPKLNDGNDVKWAFPHSIPEVLEIGEGSETGAGGGAGFAQLAVIVRPTPLQSVRDVSKANELMPQKSTFFYPKLATGLFMNPLA
ncbi:MAG: DUF1015 domain-containing protein [Phycisphaeraceae bacterium]|nr:DUF1015 domain-containing protein [Phycisphaerales bacterium]MCB9859062.1 DUF1015 domain-containing protein [Phycisphaeraceae bacterium]